MPDPVREAKRALRFSLLWNVIPWWRVAPEERPLMWRVFWWRFLGTGLVLAGLLGAILLMGPMAAVSDYIMRLAGPEAERNPGPYLLLSAVLTVLVPILSVAAISSVVRHWIRRRRGLDL